MKTIRLLVTLLTVTLIIGAASGCAEFAYDNSTVIAQVTAIDGQKVTLIVGEMDMGGMQGGDMTPPTGDGTMPEMPEGGFGEMPTPPNGETMPEGEMPQMPEGGMQMPNGEIPDRTNAQMPFVAGDDSITLTLNEETVKTLSVDDIVQIVFGDNGNVESLTVLGGNMPGGFGGNRGDRTPPSTDTAESAPAGS